jgi:hypothetical protein
MRKPDHVGREYAKTLSAQQRYMDGAPEIRSRNPNDEYREGWERIWGHKDTEQNSREKAP